MVSTGLIIVGVIAAFLFFRSRQVTSITGTSEPLFGGTLGFEGNGEGFGGIFAPRPIQPELTQEEFDLGKRFRGV